jgi:hypothetical protein
MATKDMRVRLSAEGQQEVIKAFRAVQQEAVKSKQTAQDASKGFDQLAKSARNLALEFLGYEAVMKGFDVLKHAVESSIELGTGIEKMQEKTGLAAETLQVFMVAAKRLGIEQESVTKGLGLFAKQMGLLATGAKKPADAVRDLFHSADALKGLTTDQQLLKVTDALGKMAAGGQKAYLATQLFGKGGLALIPVLNELSGKGFEDTKEKLESLGIAMSDDFVANAHRAEQAMGDLKLASQGVAMQFSGGFLQSLTDVAEGLAGAGGKGGSAMKELGRQAGEAMKTAILAFGGTVIGLEALGKKAIAIGKAIWEASPIMQEMQFWKTGKIKTLPEIWGGLESDWAAVNADTQLKFDALGNIVSDKAQEILKKIKTAPDAGSATASAAQAKARAAAAERLAKAQLGLAMANSQAILRVDQETNRTAAEFEKQRWELGVESATRYYEVRRRLAATWALEESNALKAEIAAQEAAQQKEKDPTKKVEIEKTIVELRAKAAELQIKTDSDHMTSLLEEAAEREKLAQGVLTFEDKILEAQGKRHEIELASIQREAEEYKKLLIKQGDPNANAKVEQFKKMMEAQADYAEANRQLEESEKRMGEARRRINDQAERGIITQKEQKTELVSLDKEWQPILDAELKTLREIAKTSGLQPLIDDADEAKAKVEDLNAALNKTKSGSDALAKEFDKSIGHDLHEFLIKGVKDSNDLGKAFELLTFNAARDFVSMLSKMMQKQSQSDKGGGSSDGSGGLFSFLKALNPQAHDAGGEITRGPWGRDRVPSWLTRGEFVVRQPVVAQPGMRLLLNAINQGTTTPSLVKSSGPKFHTGGEVSGGYVLGGGQKGGKAELTVGLDYGLVMKNLEAHPDFGRVIVRHLGDNRKAANSALGR